MRVIRSAASRLMEAASLLSVAKPFNDAKHRGRPVLTQQHDTNAINSTLQLNYLCSLPGEATFEESAMLSVQDQVGEEDTPQGSGRQTGRPPKGFIKA